MLNLLDENSSYIIINPFTNYLTQHENKIVLERICSVLYPKNYTIFPIYSFSKNIRENSILAMCPDDNNTLRKDSVFLMDKFGQENVIVKYKNDIEYKLIEKTGEEFLLNIKLYPDLNENQKLYVFNSMSFSFEKKKRYFFPSKKDDIKKGMLVEYLNEDRWIPKTINNVDLEYEKMYKLLMKYQKMRVSYS